eukprot:9476162-Pyramimonas_sp.AAC.1
MPVARAVHKQISPHAIPRSHPVSTTRRRRRREVLDMPHKRDTTITQRSWGNISWVSERPIQKELFLIIRVRRITGSFH